MDLVGARSNASYREYLLTSSWDCERLLVHLKKYFADNKNLKKKIIKPFYEAKSPKYRVTPVTSMDLVWPAKFSNCH